MFLVTCQDGRLTLFVFYILSMVQFLHESSAAASYCHSAAITCEGKNTPARGPTDPLPPSYIKYEKGLCESIHSTHTCLLSVRRWAQSVCLSRAGTAQCWTTACKEPLYNFQTGMQITKLYHCCTSLTCVSKSMYVCVNVWILQREVKQKWWGYTWIPIIVSIPAQCSNKK